MSGQHHGQFRAVPQNRQPPPSAVHHQPPQAHIQPHPHQELYHALVAVIVDSGRATEARFNRLENHLHNLSGKLERLDKRFEDPASEMSEFLKASAAAQIKSTKVLVEKINQQEIKVIGGQSDMLKTLNSIDVQISTMFEQHKDPDAMEQLDSSVSSVSTSVSTSEKHYCDQEVDASLPDQVTSLDIGATSGVCSCRSLEPEDPSQASGVQCPVPPASALQGLVPAQWSTRDSTPASISSPSVDSPPGPQATSTPITSCVESNSSTSSEPSIPAVGSVDFLRFSMAAPSIQTIDLSRQITSSVPRSGSQILAVSPSHSRALSASIHQSNLPVPETSVERHDAGSSRQPSQLVILEDSSREQSNAVSSPPRQLSPDLSEPFSVGSPLTSISDSSMDSISEVSRLAIIPSSMTPSPILAPMQIKAELLNRSLNLNKSSSKRSPSPSEEASTRSLRSPKKRKTTQPVAGSSRALLSRKATDTKKAKFRWPQITDDAASQKWIQCDNCEKWYHFACVGLVTEGDESETFNCPPCRAGARRPNKRAGSTKEKLQCARPGCAHNTKDDEFFISRIIARSRDRRTIEGKYMWLVEWDGYQISASTWQEEDSIPDPKQLIEDFYDALAAAGVVNDPDANVVLPDLVKKIPQDLLTRY
ncbi:hypothetical protein C8J56DRAFT_1038563 [Mycena floridula]|nr:hypothetical protein C8J56DRAFT_1038563 [Mycena floridula]